MPAAQKANRSVWLVRLTASAAGLAAAAAITMAVMLSGQAGRSGIAAGPISPERRLTDVAGAQAWMPGSGVQEPRSSEAVQHHMLLPDAQPAANTAHSGTLFDGKVVRDAVIYWDEMKLKGQ
jgi:hypothetical protein